MKVHGIETVLHKQQNGDCWRIYVLTKTAPVLQKILLKELGLLQTMKYKIG